LRKRHPGAAVLGAEDIGKNLLILARLLAFVAGAAIAGALIAFVVTRNRRWLVFTLQLLRLSLVLAAVLALLLILERVL
jgi:hypothetical protein